jgi:hypothetical protein
MSSTAEYVRLEGVSPERFDGDHARTRNFLNRFKQLALMKRRCRRYEEHLEALCLFSVFDRWAECRRMDRASERASIRPARQNSERSNDASPNKTAWDVLEEDFLQSFVDYVERERA